MPPAMDSQLARSNCIFVSGSSEGEEREETGPLLQTDAEEEKDTPLLLSVCMHKQWGFFPRKCTKFYLPPFSLLMGKPVSPVMKLPSSIACEGRKEGGNRKNSSFFVDLGGKSGVRGKTRNGGRTTKTFILSDVVVQ